MKCILVSPDRPPIETEAAQPPPRRIEVPILDGPPVKWFDEDEPRPLRREGELPPGMTCRTLVFTLAEISTDDPPVATYTTIPDLIDPRALRSR